MILNLADIIKIGFITGLAALFILTNGLDKPTPTVVYQPALQLQFDCVTDFRWFLRSKWEHKPEEYEIEAGEELVVEADKTKGSDVLREEDGGNERNATHWDEHQPWPLNHTNSTDSEKGWSLYPMYESTLNWSSQKFAGLNEVVEPFCIFIITRKAIPWG